MHSAGAWNISICRQFDRSIATRQKNNNRFSSLVLGIVKSPAFQMSKAKETPTDSSAAASKPKTVGQKNQNN
jgi:hypothetical protein